METSFMYVTNLSKNKGMGGVWMSILIFMDHFFQARGKERCILLSLVYREREGWVVAFVCVKRERGMEFAFTCVKREGEWVVLLLVYRGRVMLLLV